MSYHSNLHAETIYNTEYQLEQFEVDTHHAELEEAESQKQDSNS